MRYEGFLEVFQAIIVGLRYTKLMCVIFLWIFQGAVLRHFKPIWAELLTPSFPWFYNEEVYEILQVDLAWGVNQIVMGYFVKELWISRKWVYY